MKSFFSEYSYSIVKMFINQIAIGIFGAMLSMATTMTGNDTFSVVVSILAVLFYLFLIYTMTWEIGSKDRISVDIGKKPKRVHLGLLLSLVANIPNFIIAIVYTVIYPFKEYAWSKTGYVIVRVVSIIIEGMYNGIVSIQVAENVYLHHFWWIYFLMTVPALLTAWIAYYAGFKNTFFGALFVGPKKDKKPKN